MPIVNYSSPETNEVEVYYDIDLTELETGLVNDKLKDHIPDFSEQEALVELKQIYHAGINADQNWDTLTLLQKDLVLRKLVQFQIKWIKFFNKQFLS